MKQTSGIGLKLILWVTAVLCMGRLQASAEEMIAYDSFPMVIWEELTEVGTLWAVRFTPVQPCTLSYCEVVTQGAAGWARLHLWLDDGFGYPAGDPILSGEVFLYGNLSYQRLDFAPKIDIGSMDFHIGIEYTREPPPFVTADSDGGTESRSKYKLPLGDWVVLSQNDLNIRAWVIYYEGEDLLPPAIMHVDIPMGFSKEGDYLVEATITDESGVRQARLHYSVNEGDWIEVPMDSLGENRYRAYIPSQEAGTVVWYYLSAVDNSPRRNVGFYPEGGDADPIIFEVVEGWGIRYDDGQPESFFSLGSPYYDSNSCAVRMTPPLYPVQVSWCCVYVNDVQEFELAVHNIASGHPGEILAGPYPINAVAPPEWVNFEIPQEEQPVIGSGDFFVAFRWSPSTPNRPEVGNDESDPDLRSLFRFGENWSEWSSGDFMLRAAVREVPEHVQESSIPAFPEGIHLIQNYPNPFNSRTKIEYFLNRDGEVSLEIFDLAGFLIGTLQSGKQRAGKHVVDWNGEDLASGIYFYRLTFQGSAHTKKMILLK